MNDQVKNYGLEEAIAAVAARGTIREIYFVACGGSYALLQEGQYVVDREAKSIASYGYSSAEFLSRAPVRLGKDSLVITCSHSGNTPETVAATEYARKAGALTISLTNLADSPLDKATENTVFYEWDPLAVTSKHNSVMLLLLVFGILDKLEGNSKYALVSKAVPALHDMGEKLKEKYAAAASEFGESHKREPVIYTMASGSNHSTAYAFAICLLQEMQWVHSACIHSGEYFHGPFEITDFDTPIIILKGLGNARKMDERALAFAEKYSKRLTVLDAEDFGLEAIAGEAAEYLTPIMFNLVLRVYAVELSDSRGHPLTVRRYMWRMEY
ncbi:fructoselysine 6-phosphate deglycase [Cohaesibacter marisflavi]|uniref:Fructoselysine 6-phosphate deglycase n=1 Tax=Cohaesibacter marisflavi TaxID=655353 RepID=A0A1I5EYA0_9HYPH|nr:SIS domain-containing protein [Cohaesibacter marisflavi]SFO16376.1 fructoselysine 6-phosphate deglycase [Cohaesibacter marisflavi]